MPLIAANSRTAEPAPPPLPSDPFQDLTSDDPNRRRRAAQGLAGRPDAGPALAAQLAEEPMALVCQAIATSLVRIGDAQVAHLLAGMIANPRAALRCIALDSLKQLGPNAADAIDSLLCDPNPDARLQAVEVMRAWPAADACPRLQRLFDLETHVNVCAAALDVAAEVGSAELVPCLESLRSRFPNETFLHFAVGLTLSRICPADGHVG